MKVSLNEINQAFDSLINGTKSREEVANWASALMFAFDDYNLEFDPSSAEDKILIGIDDLMRADLLNLDNSYFYSIKDFINWKANIFST